MESYYCLCLKIPLAPCIHLWFKQNLPISDNNAPLPLPTIHHRTSNKESNTRYEKPAFELLVRVPRDSENIKMISTAPGCLLEMEAWSLLLKTPCIPDTGLRGPELYLTLKPPSWGLAFRVPEGTCKIPKEGLNSPR